MSSGVSKPPIVIMAHGFAAERTFRLPAFAERFTERGIAVFLFDYRNFGSSDGEPRNLVNPWRHLQDWEAAIAHVRALPQVSSDKIALWGSSFSGGHVIMAAARDPQITAIIAQVPFVDGISTAFKTGLRHAVQGSIASLRDVIRIITFRAPYYIPVVGAPDTFAVMNTPESMPGYLALVPENSSWKNECPARALLTLLFYRPIALAKRVKCPALLVMAEKDSLTSPKAVERTASKMSKATLFRLPVGHFDVYVGETFERVVKMEADFLEKYLKQSNI